MLHIRNAYDDALEVLKAHAEVRGDVHFFAGNWDIAKKFLDLGFTLSFTGVVTFTHDYDEVVKIAPLDMLLSETDAPYVTPAPYRGKRNEPAYVEYVVRKIARDPGRRRSRRSARRSSRTPSECSAFHKFRRRLKDAIGTVPRLMAEVGMLVEMNETDVESGIRARHLRDRLPHFAERQRRGRRKRSSPKFARPSRKKAAPSSPKARLQ